MTKPNEATVYVDPLSDVLSARLVMARAVLLAMTSGYSGEDGFPMTHGVINETIWAVEELLA